MFRANADLFTRANLVFDINSRRRIVTDTHRGQRRAHAALDFRLNFFFNFACQTGSFKFDHINGHKKAHKAQTTA